MTTLSLTVICVLCLCVSNAKLPTNSISVIFCCQYSKKLCIFVLTWSNVIHEMLFPLCIELWDSSVHQQHTFSSNLVDFNTDIFECTVCTHFTKNEMYCLLVFQPGYIVHNWKSWMYLYEPLIWYAMWLVCWQNLNLKCCFPVSSMISAGWGRVKGLLNETKRAKKKRKWVR